MADEDSVATQRIIELAQENELLLQDVEEYRQNEDDYIAKITALQKYVVNYKTSQKKVEELTGNLAASEDENASLTTQVEGLKAELQQLKESASEASERHVAEVEAQRVEHDNDMEELKRQCLETFNTGNQSHAAEIQKLKDAIEAASGVETVEQYFNRIDPEIRDVVNGYELYMKNMRNNVSFEGIPWPLPADEASLVWGKLPVPALIKKAHDAGHNGVVSMVTLALKSKSSNAFDPADPKGMNPVRDIIATLLDAELHAAYYFMTLQKLAAASTGDGISGGLNRSGTASSGGGGSNQGGSIPSTARSGAPGKGLSLWA